MIYPEPLKTGDKVGLIAPSGVVGNKKVDMAVNAVKKLGLNPVVGKNATKEYGYFAGNDELRAEDLNTMFEDKSINGIFALRGGYGSQRIIDKIDWNTVSLNPKVFVGYSDITALHIAINQRCNFVTFHGPMAAAELSSETIDAFTIKSLLRNTHYKNYNCFIKNPKNIPIKTLVKGSFKGRLIGGNLTLLVASLGTQYEVQTAGKVLFLEDVNEPPYKIDRMLTQLRNAGKLNSVVGILLGYFTGCNVNVKESFSILDVFKDILSPLGIPCKYNIACGHKLPTLTLPIGANISFK